VEIRWLGHAAFALEHDGTTVLIDPFLSGNPKAAISPEEARADAILLTHGHQDHLGDTIAIAERTGAHVLAISELASELAEQLPGGHPVANPNLGGTVTFEWGSVRLVPAWHTSRTPRGTVNTPAGLVVEFAGVTIYHLGDTALFSDLRLPSERSPIDVALMCIGGHFTMDPVDAVAAASLVAADVVIPCHYGTFPLIDVDPQPFQQAVEEHGYAQVSLLAPGDSVTR
jgi:L-ascorbate metabolism protein UlaG (beta-lactamase superfamily)